MVQGRRVGLGEKKDRRDSQSCINSLATTGLMMPFIAMEKRGNSRLKQG